MGSGLKTELRSVTRQLTVVPAETTTPPKSNTMSGRHGHLRELARNIPVSSQLMFPEQQYTDDFLRTMSTVMRWSRWCGALSGGGSRAARLWASCLAASLGTLIAVTFAGLAHALAGWTFHNKETGAVSSSTAGLIFYLNALGTLVITWRLGSSWRQLATRWAAAERALAAHAPASGALRRDIITVVAVVSVASLVEHVMSVVSAVGVDCPWSELLRRYTLASHGFLITPEQYTWWAGVSVFVVSNVATVLWNLQDLVIVLLSLGLSSRYQRLNNFAAAIVKQCERYTSGHSGEECGDRRGSQRHRYRPPLTLWRVAREAFARQAALVRHVDGALGPLVLLSFFNNFYFICLQMFNGMASVKGALKRCYFIMSLFWLCARAAGVVLAASDVHYHSRCALMHTQACPSHYYSVEVHRLQIQLSKDSVSLTGMHFFEITRSFLLKVTGAIITYEIVLVQFEESTCK